VSDRLGNELAAAPGVVLSHAASGLERIGDVPIHFADSLVRRALSLQKTRDAAPPQACMNARTLASLGIADGDQVRVSQGDATILLFAAENARVPDGAVRIAAAHPLTAALGPMTGSIRVERLAAAAQAGAR